MEEQRWNTHCCYWAVLVHVWTRHPTDKLWVNLCRDMTFIPQGQPAGRLTVAEGSFKLWSNYTLKASLRRYSSLAISSATQPGISGMATWMMYFRRMAKCCKTSRTTNRGQACHTSRQTTTVCLLLWYNCCFICLWTRRQLTDTHTQTHIVRKRA